MLKNENENKLWNLIPNQFIFKKYNKKTMIKKRHKKRFKYSTQVNPPNLWLESWNKDNYIEIKA